MRVFLIRHGETVDNVAGLYAGVRDSRLTAHGVLQAQRLGAHLTTRVSTIGPIRHIFSSDLQRATNTAQAIIDAQTPRDILVGRPRLRLVKATDLRERDFRSADGKRYGTPRGDAESHAEMHVRADRFIRNHLGPLLRDGATDPEASIVVVAHGLILNSVLRALLMRFAPDELVRLTRLGPGRAPYIAAWGNTGYVEATVKVVLPAPTVELAPAPLAVALDDIQQKPVVSLFVKRVNFLGHLEGLKKTRGGIGSAQFDRRQTFMDSFLRPVAKTPKAEVRKGS
ncbi:histidine phosphatase superfamily [Podospora appendiculata]|uniref:Histidine phosphatase superfamily n=1 Tax=Podospora appendiculata TaxID=314037 RepID=A0AAE0X264_9PEZI|nr:histidine phosphatase superfamily [Podospora appendiculata]